MTGDIEGFLSYLRSCEKSQSTISKYVYEAGLFIKFAGSQKPSSELLLSYKEYLTGAGFTPATVNLKIAAVNCYLKYIGCADYCLQSIRVQKKPYVPESKDLTIEDYRKLLEAAGEGSRLYMILETMASTGIRVSELQYFTVDSVFKGEIEINNKGKIRYIIIPAKLQASLAAFCSREHIEKGTVFITNRGNPVDRFAVYHDMKDLAVIAGLNPEKVHPHNLRKLFAKTFYEKRRDLAVLADILGHSSIETTRLYIMEPAEMHRKYIESLDLVL